MAPLERTQAGPVARSLRPSSTPASARTIDPLHTPRMRAPRPACSAIQSRMGASFALSGAPTAGTTTRSGCRALPERMSSNVYVGTIAGPPSTAAGTARAAIV